MSTEALIYIPEDCITCPVCFRNVVTGVYICLDKDDIKVIKLVKKSVKRPDWCPLGANK